MTAAPPVTRAPAPPAGRPARVLRVGRVLALPVDPRALVWGGVLVLALLAAGVATLTLGRLGIPLADLPGTLLHDPGGKAGFVLHRLRGPRLVVSAGVGAALGLSGALFQTVTRNPLGSPDVIGLGAGAGAGAALAALLWPGVVPVPLGALAGAGVAMLLVALATGTGFGSPGRVIVAGIGVAAMASAVTQYVVSTVLRDQAAQLAAYLTGSVAAASWADARLIGLALLVVLPLALVLSDRLRLIEMGDELADTLGGQARRTRALAIVVAVLAAAAAATVAGPIAFVALTAPQVARRLTGSAGAGVLAAAVTGALIMVVADLVVQQAPWADGLPVGILTGAVGGAYLGFLLLAEWRKGRM
ncbi:FecCD family ABC transporter permease [Cellulomonas hominis]|uniref:FecCD family ABC transporter permease n=1 Tax=Cellulomonas hominis TaxID=156981 RepID=UPI001BA09AED|nr:iron chelate uptake ABC transporter family permease subunit [Cellulomonas hominis]VTR75318.1 Ferric enterobactin transport system permease protein FepG [Cellulomonas hominis]